MRVVITISVPVINYLFILTPSNAVQLSNAFSGHSCFKSSNILTPFLLPNNYESNKLSPSYLRTNHPCASISIRGFFFFFKSPAQTALITSSCRLRPSLSAGHINLGHYGCFYILRAKVSINRDAIVCFHCLAD